MDDKMINPERHGVTLQQWLEATIAQAERFYGRPVYDHTPTVVVVNRLQPPWSCPGGGGCYHKCPLERSHRTFS